MQTRDLDNNYNVQFVFLAAINYCSVKDAILKEGARDKSQ